MSAQYSVIDYVRLKDPVLVEKRFENLELLAKSELYWYHKILRLLDDPQFAKDELKRCEERLKDLKEGMQNCIEAIRVLTQK